MANNAEYKATGNGPLISVLVPSLNSGAYIAECLESIVNQTHTNLQVICIDAGSTDETVSIIESFMMRDDRISLVHSDRRSYGYQMNLGLDYAKGDYIGIVETDDYIDPDMYEHYCAALQEYGKVDLVKSDYAIFVGEGDTRKFTVKRLTSMRAYYNKVVAPKDDPALLRLRNLTQPGIYSRALIEQHGIRYHETPGASYQDNGFWFQVFMFAESAVFIDGAPYKLRRDNPGSSVYAKDKVFAMCDEYDFIRNIILAQPDKQQFLPWCARMRLGNYLYTLQRIDQSDMPTFFQRWADDFIELQQCGELDKRLYDAGRWERLNAIMCLGADYYYLVYQQELQLKDLQAQAKAAAKPKAKRQGAEATPVKTKGFSNPFKKANKLVSRRTQAQASDSTQVESGGFKDCAPEIDGQRYKYLSSLPPEKYVQYLEWQYRTLGNGALDLENPQSYNEKAQQFKIRYLKHEVDAPPMDALEQRKWAQSVIGEKHLPKLVGVWDSLDEVDFAHLPENFVLRLTHGKGLDFEIYDKEALASEELLLRIEQWMRSSYAFAQGLNVMYLGLQPRIMVEELLKERINKDKVYYFWCFDGTVAYIQVNTMVKGKKRSSFYDRNWILQPFSVDTINNVHDPCEKPSSLGEMISVAERLAKGYPHLIIELAEVDGAVVFNRVDPFYEEGYCDWRPPESGYLMGQLWNDK